MKSKVARVGGVVAVLVAFVAGYALGHRTTFAGLTPMLAAETELNLAQRIDTLARVRTGDIDGAVAALEGAVDAAALTLPQGQPWSSLEPRAQRSLQLAKAYRTKYPPAPPDAALSALLDTIPMPDVKYCSPAVQRMLGTE